MFSDVDLYALDDNAKVKINGMEVPVSSLPYQHPSGRFLHPRGLYNKLFSLSESGFLIIERLFI